MSIFSNFREDWQDGSHGCVRCRYYSFGDRLCVATMCSIPNPVLYTCDGFYNAKKDNTEIPYDEKTKTYLIKDSLHEAIIHRYTTKQEAIQAEATQRMGGTPISRNGDKIIVHGKALDISEYELIADEVKKEN